MTPILSLPLRLEPAPAPGTQKVRSDRTGIKGRMGSGCRWACGRLFTCGGEDQLCGDPPAGAEPPLCKGGPPARHPWAKEERLPQLSSLCVNLQSRAPQPRTETGTSGCSMGSMPQPGSESKPFTAEVWFHRVRQP